MANSLDPFRFVLIAVSGWMNGRQLSLIDHLREENRVLREQLGGKRLHFTDHQRRRLAVKAKGLGRKVLVELGTIVTERTRTYRGPRLVLVRKRHVSRDSYEEYFAAAALRRSNRLAR